MTDHSEAQSTSASRHSRRRAAGLGALLGAATLLVVWLIPLVASMVGLVLGMPQEYGGLGLGIAAVWLVWILSAAAGVALLWLAIIVARLIRLQRPSIVVLGGLAVMLVIFAVVALLPSSVFAHASLASGVLALLASGSAGFAIMAALTTDPPNTHRANLASDR